MSTGLMIAGACLEVVGLGSMGRSCWCSTTASGAVQLEREQDRPRPATRTPPHMRPHFVSDFAQWDATRAANGRGGIRVRPPGGERKAELRPSVRRLALGLAFAVLGLVVGTVGNVT